MVVIKITDKEKYGEAIKDLKEDGLSWQEIAETLNLGYDQVRHLLFITYPHLLFDTHPLERRPTLCV